MLIKQEFQIGDDLSQITVTFERQLNHAIGIEDWNKDTLTIKCSNEQYGKTIVLENEEAHEFLKICRDTKFIFTNGNQ